MAQVDGVRPTAEGAAGATAATAGAKGAESLLEVRELSCGYGGRALVGGASFAVGRGEFACIIGANGCGKTTLLKTVLGLLPPLAGSVLVHGVPVSAMDERQRARALAYIPQAHRPPFPYSVADVVLMGRTPHVGRFSTVSHNDRRVAWDALCQLGIEGLAECTYTRLSGGQQQLVLIARALAQQPELIVMDEPTASLDFGNQQTVLSRMRDLSRGGASVLMVTHDPHQAIYCADTVIVIKDGGVARIGTPDEVITRATLEEIYGTPVDVVDVPLHGGGTRRVCIPL